MRPISLLPVGKVAPRWPAVPATAVNAVSPGRRRRSRVNSGWRAASICEITRGEASRKSDTWRISSTTAVRRRWAS